MSTQKPIGRLRDVALSMVRGLDFGERTAAAVRGARAIESADAAALMLRDQIADALVIVAQDGLSAAYAEAQRVPMDRARELYRGPDVHVILDLTHRPLGDPALLKAEGLARALAVGDTLDDLRMAQRFAGTAMGKERAVTPVILCPPEDEDAYRAAGARHFIRAVSELPAMARSLAS